MENKKTWKTFRWEITLATQTAVTKELHKADLEPFDLGGFCHKTSFAIAKQKLININASRHDDAFIADLFNGFYDNMHIS